MQDVWDVIDTGKKNRAVGITQVHENKYKIWKNMMKRIHYLATDINSLFIIYIQANFHSSRSHSLVCVSVEGENLVTNTTTVAKLYLVDLAG